nr:type II toxin-antitoxin system ParD family antitoxin [Flavobacterium sp. CF108]
MKTVFLRENLKNAEVRAGLNLLKEGENKLVILKKAIQEGIDSGLSLNFDPKNHLERLKAKREND